MHHEPRRQGAQLGTLIKRYRPDGKWESALFFVVPTGILFSAVLGAAYQWVVLLNPIIYLNFLLITFLAAVISFLGGKLVRLSHCRNSGVAILVLVLFGLSALLGSYGSLVYFTKQRLYQVAKEELHKRFGYDNPSNAEIDQLLEKLEMDLSPYGILKDRVVHGFQISVSRRGRAGAPLLFNNELVFLVWLLEALILLAPLVRKGMIVTEEPYCHGCDAWADQVISVGQYFFPDRQESEKLKLAGSVSELLQRPHINPLIQDSYSAPYFLDFTLKACPVCDSCAYLCIDECGYTLDKNNKEKLVRVPIQENVVLDEQGINLLAKNHGLLGEGGL